MQHEKLSLNGKKLRSRVLQLSLRTLLLAVVFLSIPLAQFAAQLRTANAQRQAVSEIHASGGACFFDYQMAMATAPLPGGKIPRVNRHWSEKFLGENIWSKVASVEFYPRKVDAEYRDRLVAMGQGRQYEWASGLPSVRRRKPQPIRKTTSFFSPLIPPKTVEREVMEATVRFDDDGMQFVAQLSHLESINLGYTYVTDAGLARLTGLEQLTELRLQGTDVSDKGMEQIGKLTRLRVLELNYTQITDVGMSHLKNLKDLETLRAWGTQVSDNGIASLTTLKKLRSLFINDTAVTDGVLESLKLMPSLEYVDLRRTKVTAVGLGKIKESLPNCVVKPDNW